MLTFTRQSMAQVLIISDTEAAYYLWDGSTLEFEIELRRQPEDFAMLSHNLVANRKVPLIIITDLTEENFRNETVMHMNARDRRALLERRLQYAYRATPYRAARVVGRESAGLRQDQVLLSGLTRPDLIQPWVDLAVEYEIAIQSITSLSFVIETYTAINHKEMPNELLVTTLENDLRLRQTFLKRGRILFSRVTTLSAPDTSRLTQDIHQETLRVHSYLERIRLISFDDTVHMLLFVEHEGIGSDLSFSDSEKIDVQCIATGSETRTGGDEEKRNIVCHFLSSVLAKGNIENIYGPPKARRFHLLKSASSWLNRAAVVLIAFTLIYKAPVALSIYDKTLQEARNLELAQPYEFQYEVLRTRFPVTPIPSGQMELVVKTLESIRRQSPDPVFITNMLTAALARSPQLDILMVEWNVEPRPDAPNAPRSSRFVTPNAYQTALLNNNTRLRVVVEGLAYSTGSYSDAQNQVLDFAYALDAIPGVSVTPLRMPTDVRLDVNITTTVGVDDLEAPFTLEMIVEVTQ